MTQKPASKETIQKLYENMGINFPSFIPQLCDCNSSLESLEPLNDEESENPEVLKLWKLLLKLHEFSLITNLDISTFLRANIRSSSNLEKRCNLKYVNVITFEGYSYLFGFGKDKTNALWEIVKKLAERINDEELIKDIVDIEQWAKEFEITYEPVGLHLARIRIISILTRILGCSCWFHLSHILHFSSTSSFMLILSAKKSISINFMPFAS